MGVAQVLMSAVVIAVGGMAVVSSAEAAGPVRQRQVNQQRRIEQGVRSGQLTRLETARLEAREAELARDIARMRVSGAGLDGHERARIEARQDALSRAIARQRHDGEGRPGR